MTKQKKKEAKKEKKEKKKLDKAQRKEQKKAEKILKKVAKLAEQVAEGKWKKITAKLEQTFGELRAREKDTLCAYHAALAFLCELCTNVVNNTGDETKRKIAADVPQLRYLHNIDDGDGINLLWRLGFEPDQGQYSLPDSSLEVVTKLLPIIQNEIKTTQTLIDKYCNELATLGAQGEVNGPPTAGPSQEQSGLTNHQKKVIGAYLAFVAGDILGAPIETWTASVVTKWFYKPIQFQDLPHTKDAPGGIGVYTGVTEMMLASTTSIFEQDCLDMKHMADMMAKVYTSGKPRTYLQSMEVVCNKLSDGESYTKTAYFWGKDGAQHIEGLTRVLPLAVTFRDSDDEVLQEAVKSLLVPTTTHHDGISAVFIMAKTLKYLLHSYAPTFDPLGMVDILFDSTKSVDIRSRLDFIRRRAKSNIVDKDKHIYRVPEDTYEHLCGQQQMTEQIEAVEALVICVCVFVEYWSEPLDAVVHAASRGGAASSISAAVGAMCGCLHGYGWIPQQWFSQMENEGECGRDGIIQLATKLAKLSHTKLGKIKSGKAGTVKSTYTMS